MKDMLAKISYPGAIGLGAGPVPVLRFFAATFFLEEGASHLPVPAQPPKAIGDASTTWSSGSADAGGSGNVNALRMGSYTSRI